MRRRMGETAVRVAQAAGYTNAGTVEFLVDAQKNFYFLEMNTRLQVEHPVTEQVTGLDLVQLQICIAAGEKLPFRQADVQLRGHAIECRVYAEDPAQQFYPSIGRLLTVVEPRGPGLRVDSGFETGDVVSQHYDALLAKVVAQAATRAEAIARLDAALARYVLLGLTTNTAFLRAVLAHPEFQAGTATTRFIDDHLAGWKPDDGPLPDAALIAAALSDLLASTTAPAANGNGAAPEGDLYSPWGQGDNFRLGSA